MQDAADSLEIGDLRVLRLGFGAMRLTGPGTWGQPSNRSEALTVLRRAIELGVNLIDTADAYGPGISERLIAEALHPYPDDLVIATKGGRTRQGPYQWARTLDRRASGRACEMSLRRLRIEQIDLYQLHTVDARVPLEDSIGALAELQAEGKVRETIEATDRARASCSRLTLQTPICPGPHSLAGRLQED